MPNNGRITLCPYYRDEKNLSISCEDTFRRFRWPAQKSKWMDDYCDKDWNACPYAETLNEMYENLVEGDEMNNKNKMLAQKNAALEKELRKTASMLGRADKREKEKDQTILELRRKNRYLEEKYVEQRNVIEEAKKAEKRIQREINIITSVHEGLIAYLMATYTDGSFLKADFDEWTEKYEYHISADFDDEDKIVRYKVDVNEFGSVGPASENESAGREETEGAGCEVESSQQEEV